MTSTSTPRRGVVNHFGLDGEVDIEIGSLSKAFSVMGGFIAAKQVRTIQRLQFFRAVFPQEGTGQLASFGPT
jgi:7-keto-8-aminopelargonate synthetase-like enzyme